jgi:hypothetical protein
MIYNTKKYKIINQNKNCEIRTMKKRIQRKYLKVWKQRKDNRIIICDKINKTIQQAIIKEKKVNNGVNRVNQEGG